MFNQIKIFIITIQVFTFTLFPINLYALDKNSGESIFKNHCAGCHINGSNIIRRSKNLKISSLKRNGIETPEAIARIAKEGIGIMNGYDEVLKENEDQIVANWIWEQSQKAWVQE